MLVQLLATAYARGAGAVYPATRYMDTLAFGAMVNGISLAWLASAASPSTRTVTKPNRMDAGAGDEVPVARARRRHDAENPVPLARIEIRLIGIAWILALATGLHQTVSRNLGSELPGRASSLRQAEGHLRDYLATNDPAQLAFPDIPYPSAEALIDRLSHPVMRTLLPVSVRTPLALQPSGDASPIFQPNRISQLHSSIETRHGLSPATPPLGSHGTWGTFDAGSSPGTGLWISAPIVSTLGGWLKIETAGQLGEPRSSLELHDAQTGVRLGLVRASRIPGDSWRAAYVRAPRRPFVFVARDTDPTH